MDLGFLKCYSGLDRFCVLKKSEKWLAEYRNLKINYLKSGAFDKDHSVLLSNISKREIRILKTIQSRIGLIKFTQTRAQFLNEKKFLKIKLKTESISYRKLRDIYSVCEEYRINYRGNELSVLALKELVWWSIGSFSYEGTGQNKIASRVNRNRTFINRTFKKSRYLTVKNNFLLLKKINLNQISTSIDYIKSNSYINNRGLKIIAKKTMNGSRQMYIAKQMPNTYISKGETNKLITKTNKKTFFFTKRLSNKRHINNVNEDQLKVHHNLKVKIFNDDLSTFNLTSSNRIKKIKESTLRTWKHKSSNYFSISGNRKLLMKPLKCLTIINKTLLSNNELLAWKPKEVLMLT